MYRVRHAEPGRVAVRRAVRVCAGPSCHEAKASREMSARASLFAFVVCLASSGLACSGVREEASGGADPALTATEEKADPPAPAPVLDSKPPPNSGLGKLRF